jgi:hypothetical protein
MNILTQTERPLNISSHVTFYNCEILTVGVKIVRTSILKHIIQTRKWDAQSQWDMQPKFCDI